jgi:hypothetical protein
LGPVDVSQVYIIPETFLLAIRLRLILPGQLLRWQHLRLQLLLGRLRVALSRLLVLCRVQL